MHEKCGHSMDDSFISKNVEKNLPVQNFIKYYGELSECPMYIGRNVPKCKNERLRQYAMLCSARAFYSQSCASDSGGRNCKSLLHKMTFSDMSRFVAPPKT